MFDDLTPPYGCIVADGTKRMFGTMSGSGAAQTAPTLAEPMWRSDVSEAIDSEPVVTDLMAGLAGEHLAMADLLMQGFRAMRSDQHCPFDIVVDLPGRVVRLQVKASRWPRRGDIRQVQPAYIFNVRRAGAGKRRLYGPDEFDVVALVALDLRLVGYMPITTASKTHVQVRVPGWTPPELDARGHRWNWTDSTRGRSFADMTFAKAIENV